MDHSTNRLQQISNRLGELGLIFERIPAFGGKILTAIEKQRINPKRSWLQLDDDEIGCTLSHLKAIHLVSDRELQRAIVLEDDATFDDDFPIWAHCDCPLPNDADVLKLEGFGAERTLKIPISSQRSLQGITAMRSAGLGEVRWSNVGMTPSRPAGPSCALPKGSAMCKMQA